MNYQINTIAVMKFINKYGGWILAAIAFLLLFTCTGNSDHSEVIKERNKLNKARTKSIDSVEKLKDAKDKIIAERDKTIEKNDRTIFDLKLSFNAEKAKSEKKLAEVKNYNLKQWELYYQDIAKCPDDQIEIKGNSLAFEREPLVTVANEIITGQTAKAQVKITLNQLAKSEDNEKLLKKNLEDERDKNMLTESQLATQKEMTNAANKNTADALTDLQKAKRPKIIPILLGAAAGFATSEIIKK